MIQKEVVNVKVAITSGLYITLKMEGEVESFLLTCIVTYFVAIHFGNAVAHLIFYCMHTRKFKQCAQYLLHFLNSP